MYFWHSVHTERDRAQECDEKFANANNERAKEFKCSWQSAPIIIGQHAHAISAHVFAEEEAKRFFVDSLCVVRECGLCVYSLQQ